MTGPVLIAHRGLEDRYPENTIVGFEAALQLGMGVELDLAMSSDRQLVVMHDETVDRTTDGSGRVSDMPLAELKELDAGSWKSSEFAGAKIPTFDEALETASSYEGIDPVIALDVKSLQPGIINMVCEALAKHGLMDRVVGIGIVARSVDVRRRFYEGSAEFRCAAVAETAETLPLALNDPYSNWIYGRFVPSASDIESVHAAGKKLFVAGDAISNDTDEAVRAVEANPDVVLAWRPAELYERITGTSGG